MGQNRIFRAKAPLRVSFAGGGTDVTPFPEREGGLVLNATIDRYATGSLHERRDDRINIESLDLGVALSYGSGEDVEFNGELDLVKAAIRRLGGGDPHRGFDLVLATSAPPGSGLGSSSALMVCLVGVLSGFHGLALDSYEVAHLAWEIERCDLGLRGGLQDQYSSAFGGFNFMEFEADRTVVNPLRVRTEILDELETNLLLCFTGRTRVGDHVIEDQTRRYEASDTDTIAGLRAQKLLAKQMKEALLRGRLTTFGELLGEAWQAKRRMSPTIPNEFIDEAYATAIEHGALGGKVTGAGGGGFMLFYCRYDRRHRVANALEAMGAKIADFSFDERGLRTWSPAGD